MNGRRREYWFRFLPDDIFTSHPTPPTRREPLPDLRALRSRDPDDVPLASGFNAIARGSRR